MTSPLNINDGTAQQGADVAVFPPGAYTSDPASSFPPYCDMVLIIKTSEGGRLPRSTALPW